MNAALLSSERMDWRTPRALLTYLDGIFCFDGDAAPDPSEPWGRLRMEGDTLNQNWPRGTWWLNPPYGRALPDWIAKAEAEADCGSTVVLLVPARPGHALVDCVRAPRDHVHHRPRALPGCGRRCPVPVRDRGHAPAVAAQDGGAPVKPCVCCGEAKPLTEFYLTASGGRQAKCRRCHSRAVNSARRVRDAPPPARPRCVACGTMPVRCDWDPRRDRGEYAAPPHRDGLCVLCAPREPPLSLAVHATRGWGGWTC